MNSVDPSVVIENLAVVATRTSTESGAQRVAWTDTWRRARAWLNEEMRGLPIEITTDEGGNQWYTLSGKRQDALVLGGHIDSVPDGGSVDGILGLLTGLAVLRRLVVSPDPPPVTVRVVDWADEEGRFGLGLLGSSAAAGTLRPESLAQASDRAGIPAIEALRENGVEAATMLHARGQLSDVRAYLELHIEQGPVLEKLGLPLGVVTGTYGVERHAVSFAGRAMHAGATPMNVRHDPVLAAAQLALRVRADAIAVGGRATVGNISVNPGIPTAVAADCTVMLDQRHTNADALVAMLRRAEESASVIGKSEGVSVQWRRVWGIPPLDFDSGLIEMCDSVVQEIAGESHLLASGPLHDAAEMVRAGVPSAMLFVQSIGGISHSRDEDTRPEHLALAVRVFDRLVDEISMWIERRSSFSLSRER